MANEVKTRALTTPVIVLDKPSGSGSSDAAGGWYDNSPRRALAARDRLGYSHAAYSSSLYESPTSHYSFYRQNRALLPEQYWSLYKQTPDVRACVDSIVRRVATWDWLIRPNVDPHDTEEYQRISEQCERARDFLSVPNRDGETWQELMTAMITDLLVYDAGVLELVYDKNKDLSEIVTWLGSECFPVVDEHGRLLHYDQDGEDDSAPSQRLERDQVVYFQLYKNNRSTLGMPLLESLINECVTCILADEHAMLALDADEIPPGLLVLGGVAGPAAERARADLQAMRGKDHRIRVVTSPQPHGIEAKWVELRHTPKDLEMRSVVDQLRRIIWRVFGVTPIELGETEGIPRAAAEVQMDVASSHLITPILELLQARVNAQIMPHIVDDPDKCAFVFDRSAPASAAEKLDDAKRAEVLLRNGVMTINEVRAEFGFLPVDGGDQPLLTTSMGPLPLSQIASGGVVDHVMSGGEAYTDADDQVVGYSLKKNTEHPHDCDCPEHRPRLIQGDWRKSLRQKSILRKYEDIDFSVPKGVRSELEKGLKWHSEGHSGDGLRSATVSWARRMANGADISPEKATKMRAWLARHESDKDGEGFYPGQDGFPSPGRVAWALWGGDPAKSWSNKIVQQMENEDSRSAESREIPTDDWLPDRWQSENRFKNARVLPLWRLADIVSDYTHDAVSLYIDAADSVSRAVQKAYAGNSELTTDLADFAKQRVSDILDDLVSRWSLRCGKYYNDATRLGYDSAEDWLGTLPEYDHEFAASQYLDEAIQWLQEDSGLVGSLRTNIFAMIDRVTVGLVDERSARIDRLDSESLGEDLVEAIDQEFNAQGHRIDHWSGKMVALSSGAAMSSVNNTVTTTLQELVPGEPPVEQVVDWYYEWVASGGKNCATCAFEGGAGFRPVAQAQVLPGQGTICGANCRCVIVFWTKAEIDSGNIETFSELPPNPPDAVPPPMPPY